MAEHLHAHARCLREGRRRIPRPDRQPDAGPTRSRTSRPPEELAMEYNGKALSRPARPEGPDQGAGQGRRAAAGLRRCCATTAAPSCGCWIYAGAWTQAGNQMARRDNADPYGIGQTLNWAWAWPANRRILYNARLVRPETASRGSRRASWCSGTAQWAGSDVPDIRADANPPDDERCGPFIMTAEGVARLFAPTGMAEGPLPEHYEPFEIAARPTTRCTRTTRWHAPTRRRACSRATWSSSARPRTSRTWPPATG